MTPLHFAARKGETAMVQLLLLKGAEKDSRNKEGITPLFLAVCNKRATSALVLPAAGADVNVR